MKDDAQLRPPRFWRLVLEFCLDPDSREHQMGDLREEFEERAEASPEEAVRWYRRQVLGSLKPNLAHRARRLMRDLHERERGDGMMRTWWNDVRVTLRGMSRNVVFSVTVVATLAVGIGANTTVFSVVYGFVINPFPFPEPDRIVGVGTEYPRLGQSLGFFENLSPHEFADIRDRSRTLESTVAWDMGNRQLTGPQGVPDNVFSGFWWGDALETLNMPAHLGRGFAQEELERGDAVALLSYEFWRDRYGADSSMVGSVLRVNDQPHTLIGILPPGVDIYGMQLWMVMPTEPESFARNRRQFQTMARIRDGYTIADVNAELAGLADQIEGEFAAEFEEYEGWSMQAETWTRVSSQFFRTGLWVVMGAVVFVLLLVSANTANLMLARAQRRRREMGVRRAMGASSGRIVSQLLTESVLLAAMGGAAGVIFAWYGVQGLNGLIASNGLPVAGTASINLPVVAFTVGVVMLTGIFFGMAPAVNAVRQTLSGTLQAEGRGATWGASRQRVQRTLVGVQVALAMLLLVGGGLMVNSFIRMNAVEPGFDHGNVLTMRLTLPREEYQGQAVPAFFEELNSRLEGVPGVRSAAAGTQFPPISFSFNQIWFEGVSTAADASLPTSLATVVTPGYFETLGIDLLRGRVFDRTDRQETIPVVVINQAAADRYFQDRDPIGQTIKVGATGPDDTEFEVIGVVASTRNRGLDQAPFPEVFAVHDQIGGGPNQLFLTVRTEVDPAGLLPAIRDVVQELDADQPVYAIRTIEEAFAGASATRRMTTVMLMSLGSFALALAVLGIYAVVSYTVSERTREIGVRIALGAGVRRVRRLVVAQALVPVVIGALVGLGLSVPLGRGLQELLYEVSGSDPLTLVMVAGALIGVAAFASWIPARRASRLDPTEALRGD